MDDIYHVADQDRRTAADQLTEAIAILKAAGPLAEHDRKTVTFAAAMAIELLIPADHPDSFLLRRHIEPWLNSQRGFVRAHPTR